MIEVNKAIAEWNTYTCLNLRPRNGEANYVAMQNGGGCASYVGRIGGGQPIFLAPGCRFVIMFSYSSNIVKIIVHNTGITVRNGQS